MTDENKEARKRVRSTNYTSEEKVALINIISKYKNTIESKKTDKVSWKDKNDTWERIGNEFNSIALSGTYRTADSLKKFYENLKKDTRKNAAQEKLELFKTGGGRPTHKILDPVHESVLALMNTKTVAGFNNRFDSDATTTFNSLSDASNILDSMTDKMTSNVANDAMSINVSTESNENTEEYIYEILDDSFEETRGITHDIHVDSNTNTSCKEDTLKRTKCISNWKTYTPEKLRVSKHTLLKAKKTNASENKENETNVCQNTARQRRPSTMALNSCHISKQYSDLAEIKFELAKLQLIAVKEEMKAKTKQNEMEFELKKKSLELDIQLKQAQLRKLQTSSLLQ